MSNQLLNPLEMLKGNLPQFTYINPECCSFDSFHPSSPISMGEAFIESIYEALCSSPQWQSTLFILTFEEHG
jgi:phospholipase C